ncbi:MAG TPA: glycoside hydrolase family 3 C-terminal domain-containing protein [Rhizomicrobium sp.]|nr:glycoside hydrolase family 3 C-terminal domain-containing protein [Rhizomicrobium sp.]
MIRIAAAVVALSAFAAGGASAQPQAPLPAQPWNDTSLSADARADLVQAQMTQDEQLLLVKGYYGANVKMSWIKAAPVALRPLLPGSAGFVPGIARLGIPALHETDAGVGIANTNWMRPGDTATAFPSGLMNAAAWNPAAAFDAGAAIGAEARDRGYNVVLDGALNLAREPRGGRTFEYAGEDPLLAGTTVGEQIRGIQSQHVISTIKHFALNDQEIGRGMMSVNIDEGAARESDLLAFEIAIEHGNPGAVMCAYNRVNSVYACENDFLLNQVLKGDWNYPGWVLSDWGGVHSTVAAANAGLDQESASGFDRQEYFGAPLKQALDAGTVSAARLHDMVHRILRTLFASGVMDYPMPPRTPPSTHADVAERNAEQGIVLLKNSGGILPLAQHAGRIAVIGAHADLGMISGGGSSQVLPLGHDPDKEVFVGGPVIVLRNGARIMPLGREIYDPPSPLAAIAAEAPGAKVRYASGADVAEATDLAAKSDVAIVFVRQWMTESDDVPDLSLPGNQNALIAAVVRANPRTIVVLETGGPVLMPWLNDVPAVLEAWYSGNGGAKAVARVLFGEVNPSGRLPITFPASEAQLPRPALPSHGIANTYFDVSYGEGADVGYRWFELHNQTPLFPFGYGLSYTTFAYDGLTVSAGDTITATVTVTNSGRREGGETVQLYVTPPPDANGAPSAARLVGWSKVSLKPGESRAVTITAEPRLLARFDIKGGSFPVDDAAQKPVGVWRIAAGDYSVSVRASATDIKLASRVTVAEREMKP